MLEVRADVEKNRLYIRHLGPLDEVTVKDDAEQVLRAQELLRPGYDVVADLRDSGPMGPVAMRQTERLMAHSNEVGVGRHVLIVGRSMETTIQFQRLSKLMGQEGFLAFTLEEAERLLDSRRT
ncbi:hypothetical protein P2318_26150 [Myxococcaceae bacterium GXIMD 01537]